MRHSSIDLHTHSTASDGTLSPTQLVRAAAEAGVRMLALTDHDTTAGVTEACTAAVKHGIQLVPGIELSAMHRNRPLHVVWLAIDPEHEALRAGIEVLTRVRRERARAMGEELRRLGYVDVLEQAIALADGAEVTRTHLARVLVEQGAARSMNEVFKRYLGRGKPGYAAAQWPSLDEVVAWIRGAGGVAVLAHPLAYRWTGAWLRRMIEGFCEAGGEAIEVVSGQTTPSEMATVAGHARRFGLLASQGSDFHSPDVPWHRIGNLPALPDDLQPVWTRWSTTPSD